MADENQEQKSQTTTPSETTTATTPPELEGKVLVAKVGHEDKFHKAIESATAIAQGKLGWDGHAEIMLKIGGIGLITGGAINPDPKWTEQEHKDAIKELLQNMHLQEIYEHGEWLTEEEAIKRKNSTEVLFGDTTTEKK